MTDKTLIRNARANLNSAACKYHYFKDADAVLAKFWQDTYRYWMKVYAQAINRKIQPGIANQLGIKQDYGYADRDNYKVNPFTACNIPAGFTDEGEINLSQTQY